MSTDNQTLIFLHLPKTGGSTLHRILDRQYKPAAVFTIDGLRVGESIAELKSLPKADKENLQVVKGHCRFGLHQLLHKPSVYITILRHPVDRVISHYYYIRQRKHPRYYPVITHDLSLQEFVCREISNTINNAQTRLLSGEPVNTVTVCDPNANGILEHARKNLQGNFIVVGLIEQFDETLILMKRAFGWKTPFYIKANITKGRPSIKEIPRETVKLIEHHNALDIELYDDAKEKFNEFKRQQDGFKLEVKTFQSLNSLYKVYRHTRTTMNRIPSRHIRR